MLLPAWAMTAIRAHDGAPSRAAAPAARAAVSATIRQPMPTRRPAATSVGWCIPRYIRARRDEQRDRDGDEPDDGPERARFVTREVTRSAMPAVDGDRRGRVAGVEAVVHRQVVEARHVRPLAVDRQRRDAVRRGLDGDRGDDERGDPPLAEHDRHERW